MSTGSPFAEAVRRDRRTLLVALGLLIALSWAYTIHLASNAGPGSGSMAMPNMMSWSATDFGFMFVMWAVMMVAMMLPSATPAVLIFGLVRDRRRAAGRPSASSAAFVTGYLLVWIGFSLLATLVNWALHEGGALSSMMGRSPPLIAGFLLVAAGVFQWTPLKRACLRHCRSPIGFLMSSWREGTRGAVAMGMHHGAYCLGCCWLLMLLLFALGIMNLLWIGVLTAVVLAEKVLPRGESISGALGVVLVLWGAWLIVSAPRVGA